MSIDNQYVRRYRQHIPFYKTPLNSVDKRYWHHNRILCDPECIFGIPVVMGQYLMFCFEDDEPRDITVVLGGVTQNSTIELCCLSEGHVGWDTNDCPDVVVPDIKNQTFYSHKICVIDGVPVQQNYMRIFIPFTECGLRYFKISAYNGDGTGQRIFYSQPVMVYTQQQALDLRLLKLNINDSCGVGGIDWNLIWHGWQDIDGYEIYLPENTRASFIEKISNEEVEEDGKGNEVQIFESVDWKYQFDTGYVPDHYAELINELALTGNNAVTMLDDNIPSSLVVPHYVEISRCETEMTSDGDGCFMNTNVQFLINKYNKDSCCDIDECECPQDEAINVESYIIDQVTAEAAASFGDVYVVPSGAVGAEWAANQNKIAQWTSGGWVYTVPTIRDMILTADTAAYYISLGGVLAWSSNLLNITSVVYQGIGTCLWDVFSVIPHNSFAKIQIKAGAGSWNDATGFLSSDVLLSGASVSTDLINNYEVRLVPLDTGCNLSTSLTFGFAQTESCA